MENKKEKRFIPYYQIAKQALMNWNGLSEQEANQLIESSSFDEIESKIGAKGSIDYAIEKILEKTHINRDALSRIVYDGEKFREWGPGGNESFSDVIFEYTERLMMDNGLLSNEAYEMALSLQEEIKSMRQLDINMQEYAIEKISKITGMNKDEISQELYDILSFRDYDSRYDLPDRRDYLKIDDQIDILFAVHDGWVRDNPEKFMAREKKFQHMPSELVGWKEMEKDMLFVGPIVEAINGPIDAKYDYRYSPEDNGLSSDELRKEEYNRRVKRFILDNGITNTDDLVSLISKEAEFYPALRDYPEDVLANIRNPEFVAENIIPSIEKDGIGKIEEKRRETVVPIMEMIKSGYTKGVVFRRNEYARSYREEPTAEQELEKLTDDEKNELKQEIDMECERLKQEKEKLEDRSTLVKEILCSARNISRLKVEISQKQSKIKREVDDFETFDFE